MNEYNIDYLLKYISNEEFSIINKRYNKYTIKDLADDRVLVDNNIRYLIRYGVNNINDIIVKDIELFLLSDKDFRDKIKKYEEKMTKDEVIYMLDNM